MAKQVARIDNTIDIKTDVFSRFWPLNVLRVGVETSCVTLVDIRDNDTVFDWRPSSGTELTIAGAVQDNGASDAIEVAAALIRDLVHSESGGGSSAPDPQVAINTAAILQNELIAKMDTLQSGEIIDEAGEIHAYGGRQWISVVDNAEVPDPVSIAALEASSDFNEFTGPIIHPFGDALITVRALDLFENREVIQQTGGDFGIYTNRFHLSDDPAIVGNLQGKTITFQRGVPKNLSLIHISEPTRPY